MSDEDWGLCSETWRPEFWATRATGSLPLDQLQRERGAAETTDYTVRPEENQTRAGGKLDRNGLRDMRHGLVMITETLNMEIMTRSNMSTIT